MLYPCDPVSFRLKREPTPDPYLPLAHPPPPIASPRSGRRIRSRTLHHLRHNRSPPPPSTTATSSISASIDLSRNLNRPPPPGTSTAILLNLRRRSRSCPLRRSQSMSPSSVSYPPNCILSKTHGQVLKMIQVSHPCRLRCTKGVMTTIYIIGEPMQFGTPLREEYCASCTNP